MSDVERVHRRVSVAALLASMFISGCLAISVWQGWAWATSGVPSLIPGDPLAEALAWPWSDYPAITGWERETIRRELQIAVPVMVAEILPWRSSNIPPSGLFSYQGEELGSVQRGTRHLEELLEAKGTGRIDLASADQSTRELHAQSEDLLTAAGDGWLPLYNRAVLHYWCRNTAAAEQDLRRALDLVQPYVDGLSQARGADLERSHEAAEVTRYALAHVLLMRTETALLEEALVQIRAAARLLGTIRHSYPEVPSQFGNFELRNSGLHSRSVFSDLLATYMLLEGYHSCAERPPRQPCPAPRDEGACSYRDRAMCATRERAGAPYDRPFKRLFARFYGTGDGWRDEHLLWALSSLVDLASQENYLSFDPHLLYNSAALMLRLGELDLAKKQILQLRQVERTGSLPGEFSERLARFDVVVKILGGEQVQPRLGRPLRETSLVRQRFGDLHASEAEPDVISFPPLGGYFTKGGQEKERLIDCWLFINLWKRWLADGEFERFQADFERLIAEPEIPQHFREWRREIMAEFGELALHRAAELETAGERDRVALIRRFVADSGHFAGEIESRARSFRWWLRTVLLWVWTAVVAVAIPMVLFLASGLIKLHRRTMLGTYYLARGAVRDLGTQP